MTHPVMILTDSSAYLPPDLVANYPIRVIPLMVAWDGQVYRDGVDFQAEEFYRRLSISKTLPQTNQLSTQEIKSNIWALLRDGSDVLMMPISSGISVTYQTAIGMLPDFPKGRVAVIDTKLVGMALGFQVMAAARAAAAGEDLSTCVWVARQAYGNIGAYGMVDSLRYLTADSRNNASARMVGAAINPKLIIQIRNGQVKLVDSAIYRNKAETRILELAEKEMSNRTPIRISVFHALAEEPAEELMIMAQKRFSPIEAILSEFSPVVGAHVGPGTLALAFHAGADPSNSQHNFPNKDGK